MKLQVTFTVDVDWCDADLAPKTNDDRVKKCVEDSVSEAIANAIRFAEGQGHIHLMENTIAILCDSPVVAKFI